MSVTLDGVSFLPDTNQPEFIAPGDKVNLGKDAFMKLLVAQMNNQDPLNPQSNEEFIAQLSQFTQVEQLMNLNDGFQGLYMAMNSMNNNSMTQLLGKEVVAQGDQFHYSGEGDAELHYNAAADAKTTNLIVYNEEGSVVFKGPIDPIRQGEGSLSWDGKGHNGQQLPEGNYRFSLEAQGSDGEVINVAEYMVGVVDEMSFVDGVPKPSIKDIQFELNAILRVGEAE